MHTYIHILIHELAYSVEVWKASSPVQFHPDATPINLLCSGFLSISAKVASGVSWGRAVKGPISAAIASAARVGWAFLGPTRLRDCQGREIDLALVSPGAIKKRVLESYFKSVVLRDLSGIANNSEFLGENVSARGFMILPLTSVFYSKGLSALQRSRLLSTTTGSTWLRTHLSKIGYAVGDRCPLCEVERDSLVHRLYECEVTRPCWSRLPKHWLREIKDRPLSYTRCLLPDITVEGLSDQYKFVLIGEGSSDISKFTFRSADGPVSIDGSCYNGSAAFASAGFAMVQVDVGGALIKAAYAALPAALPNGSDG